MKRTTFTRFFVVVTVLLSAGPLHAAPTEGEFFEQSRRVWSDFLEKQCNEGTSEQAVRKLMAGEYRDVAFVQVEGDNRLLAFLIDDFRQVEFVFGDDNKLISTPRIEPKGQWLRSPDGRVISIPSPAERGMKASAEKAAMRYVAERTRYDRDSLSTFCRRSVKSSVWNVTVTIKSLEVDTAVYLLEVTDDGG